MFNLRVAIVAFILVSCQKEPRKGEDFVIQSMERYQRFSQKLWFAGQESNWELAEFYTHEIHEVTEELIGSTVFHDDRDISKLAGEMMEEKIAELDQAVDAQEEELFVKNYLGLINSCNACHTATEHDFIKIKVPVINPFNQEF